MRLHVDHMLVHAQVSFCWVVSQVAWAGNLQ